MSGIIGRLNKSKVLYEALYMLTEILRCFDETVQIDPSISEAVAAIQTLLEVIKRSNGEICIIYIYRLLYLLYCGVH